MSWGLELWVSLSALVSSVDVSITLAWGPNGFFNIHVRASLFATMGDIQCTLLCGYLAPYVYSEVIRSAIVCCSDLCYSIGLILCRDAC